MAYKRYIKRGGKRYGPYIYHSRKEGEKVISEYIGKNPKNINKNKSKKYLFIALGIFVLLSLAFILNLNLTGKVTLSIDNVYIYTKGENLDGVMKLILEQEELIPASSKVIISLNNTFYEYTLSDLISERIIEGDFNIKGKSISGSGQGYGFSINDFPTVSFILDVYSKKDKKQKSSKSKGLEVVKEPKEEKEIEEPKEEKEIEEPKEEKEIEEPKEEKENTSEKSITGNLIFGSIEKISDFFLVLIEKSTLEKEIQGQTSITNSFSYDLSEDQIVKIRPGSVRIGSKKLLNNDVSLNIKDNQAIVTTDYKGKSEKELIIDLNRLKIPAEEGDLTVILIYNGVEIVYATKRVKAEDLIITNITKGNLSIETIQYGVVINKPVKWKKRVKLNKLGNVSINIPKQAENINIYEIEEREDISAEVQQNENLTIKKIKRVSDEKVKITGKVLAEINLRQQTIPFKLIKFLKTISGRAIDTEEQGEKEITIDANATIYEIEYETPGPVSIEKDTSYGKEIVISSGIHYENILAYTELPKEVPEYSIKLYNIVDGKRIKVNTINYDTNNNFLIDYIEWIIPHLSNQTYDLVIEISKAEHLDENRTFVEEVYDYVNERDNNWTEIPAEHYLRVTFNKNLTSERDITIYARSNYTNASVEVYEKDGTEIIAGFGIISEDKKYKIYLTNLTHEQDTFDLKIINNFIEFDYIVDPITLIEFVSPTLPNNTQTTNTSIEINVSIEGTNLSDVIYNWNGTNFTMYNDSLVLMMNFDNVSALGENDTLVVDVSGYGNNGTVVGNITNSSGKFGRAMQFDGANDYIVVADDDTLDFGTADFTISMWVKRDSTGEAYLLNKYSTWLGFRFEFDSIDRLQFSGANDSSWDIDATSSGTITDTNWHHIAVVGDKDTIIQLYIDGIADGSDNTNININLTNDGTDEIIGGHWQKTPTASDFDGLMDELRILNRTLTAAEINQSYFSNLNKYDTDKWLLYVNQSKNATDELDYGTYTYQTFASDTLNNWNQTEERTVILKSDITFPNIGFVSPTLPNNTQTTNISIEINVSITNASDLKEVIYNWNGTNYTIYNNSLVLMMNFDNVSTLGENDTHVFDVSGNGHNGTVNITKSTWNPSGKYNGAFEFDGTYKTGVIVDNDDNLNFGNFTDFTLACWVKTGYVSDWQYMFFKGKQQNDRWWGVTTEVVAGTVKAHIDDDITPLSSEGTTNITDNNWHYVVATYDRDEYLSVYVDGVQEGTPTNISSIGNISSPQDLGIGAGRFFSTYFDDFYFNGSIDEPRIYNRSLTAEEINQSYFSNLNKYAPDKWLLYVNQSKNTIDELDDGTYTYQTFASDTSDNWNQTEERTVIKSNITYPITNIVYPQNDTYIVNVTDLNYTYTETNPDKCWWSNSSGVWNSSTQTCGTNWTGLISNEGSNTWTVFINDTSGNENSSSITFTKDTAYPAVTINSPLNQTYDTITILFNVTATDGGGISSCWYSLNAGTTNSSLT
ncbi:MAG: LamG domain-containing protein, partial [Promethearchaeota archaeon]